jgi:hypothetical protein
LNSENYPAPWNLKGKGFIFPFLSDEKKMIQSQLLSAEDQKDFLGGLGAVMLVNYEESNVGPYYELLFMPGDFRYKNKKYKRITRIYVSSKLSISQGIKNWAIPKEFADFTWKENGNFSEISAGNFFRIKAEKILFPFPITTSLYPVKLCQKQSENSYLLTRFNGNGKGKIAKIHSMDSDNKFFPDFSLVSKFHFGLSVDNFKIMFPVAETI